MAAAAAAVAADGLFSPPVAVQPTQAALLPVVPSGMYSNSIEGLLQHKDMQ
jgi:hypothetical protein